MKQINTEKELNQIIEQNKIVLIDFYASWCGPCRMLNHVLEELSKEKTDCTFIKVDVDQARELAQKFEVMSIPTIVVYKNQKVNSITNGFRPKEEIIKLLNK